MEEMEQLVQALKANKPRMVFINPQALENLNKPNTEWVNAVLFNLGGSANGKDAVPYVHLTPELLAILRKATGYVPPPPPPAGASIVI